MLSDARDFLVTLERELPPHPPAPHALMIADDGRLTAMLSIASGSASYALDEADLARDAAAVAAEIVRMERERQAAEHA